MFTTARNKFIAFDDTEIDYVTFGKGSRNLILIPGLGDGIKTVKGTAAIMELTYKLFAANYHVYIFSRRNDIPQGYSTRDMSNDIARTMKFLSIDSADVIGVSQGGMIAQYLAIDHPETVNRLVLAVTISKPNPTLTAVIKKWISHAEARIFKDLFIDTYEKTYTAQYVQKYRKLLPLMILFNRPHSFERFITQAKSCIAHNAYDELNKISCPTLVIGGECDNIVGSEAAGEIAARIPNSELYIYPSLGHGAYEEADDFEQRTLNFLTSK